jgi:CheY-like chemotaxis protein
MKILIAEDDPTSRILLRSTLKKWNYTVLEAATGSEALTLLATPDPPQLSIVDWMMPGMDGIELIKQIRKQENGHTNYLILLTAAKTKEGLVNAFAAGADDYLTKPFDKDELESRLKAATRILTLQGEAVTRISELQTALNNVRQLEGLLPMCSYCRKIRQVDNDQNYWSQLEHYVSQHTNTQFSHGICPDCYKLEVEPQLAARGIASKNSGEIHHTPLDDDHQPQPIETAPIPSPPQTTFAQVI